MQDLIADKLGLNPIVPIAPVIQDAHIVNIPPEDSRIEEDYEYTRTKIKNATDQAEAALGEMMNLASMMQDPKAYQTVAILVKTIADTSKLLLDSAETVHKIKPSQTTDPQNVTNNLNMTMTTADLLNIVKKAIDNQ